jgi:hypothetical protein
MKKIILFFIFNSIWASTQGQGHSKNIITGSWININVSDYYESNNKISCDTKYFDNNEFVPSYLSFENNDQLRITFKIEQKIFTYTVTYFSSDSIIIHRGNNIFKIYLNNDLLKLQYYNKVITFKKVSDHYSTDVFGEFIKSVIFKKYLNFITTSFKKGNHYNDKIINRNNFKMKMKEIFMCDAVDFAQLALFNWRNSCLPEIAIYYSKEDKWVPPRVLGLLIDNDNVKFIDSSGRIILTLTPK